MYKLCVFAGTTEGRRLIAFLAGQPVKVTACVATEYGETLLEAADNLTISAHRLTEHEMTALFMQERFNLVIDATHPYAVQVTASLQAACGQTNTAYLRLLREEDTLPDDAVFVPDMQAAAAYLDTTDGNVMLTTGSKELHVLAHIAGFAERVYARVLPMPDSLSLCQAAGVKPAHILAMQGPFSKEMNLAMLRMTNAKILVTKEGGKTGGFEEKRCAAKEAGARLVVVGRPPQTDGVCLSEVIRLLCARFSLESKPVITIAGIGPGGQAAMTQEVRSAIKQSDCLIGAKRMLDAAAQPGQALYTAIAPEEIMQIISAHPEHHRITLVQSGDIGFFSGAKKLLPRLTGGEIRVLPGLSAMSVLCARLHTSYEDVFAVSLHGRTRNVARDVRTHSRVFVLVGGQDGVSTLCRSLMEAGLGNVRVSVGERLSYCDERITVGTAAALAEGAFDALSAVLIENAHACEDIVTQGLPDDTFQRGSSKDGIVPMTKSEVRAVCLSKLRLTRDAVCWDIGAGTGSVAIEMALAASKGHVYAVERKEEAVTLLTENVRRLSPDNLTVVHGTAPTCCQALPAPTHVFIGGSTGAIWEIIACALAKNPRARIVATAIALETIKDLIACEKQFLMRTYEAVSVSVARSHPVGSYHMMTGQNPVYIFTMQDSEEIVQ